MENNILKHRMAVMNNIAKSFGYEKSEDLLEKAEDNDIEKAKHQDGDMHPMVNGYGVHLLMAVRAIGV